MLNFGNYDERLISAIDKYLPSLKNEDEAYINNHKEEILKFLQSYNPENQILYIMSSQTKNSMSIDSSGSGICLIRQPKNDFVRNWIDVVPGLRRHLYSVTKLSFFDILKNICICYKKKIIRKILSWI